MEEMVENMLKQLVHDCVYLSDGGAVHFKGLIVEIDENGNAFTTLYSKEQLEVGYWVKSLKEYWPRYVVMEVRKIERGVKAYKLVEA